MKFSDIQKFPRSYYAVNVSFDYLAETLKEWDQRAVGNPLILNPEWQRGHVWRIQSKKDLLKVYIDLNSGGTPHDQKELDRVQAMIDSCGDEII